MCCLCLLEIDCNQLEISLNSIYTNFHFLSSRTVQIPESEDGGSMLGSSKRSLADTSVTSTADLSIFSGAERRRSASQQNNHNDSLTANDPLNSSDIDLHNTADGEVDGESSPK